MGETMGIFNVRSDDHFATGGRIPVQDVRLAPPGAKAIRKNGAVERLETAVNGLSETAKSLELMADRLSGTRDMPTNMANQTPNTINHLPVSTALFDVIERISNQLHQLRVRMDAEIKRVEERL